MLKPETYTRGTISSLFFNIIAKLIQFANIFIIASLFGANSQTDLYYFLLNFITVVVAGFIGGIDVSVLIPEFIRLRENDDEKKAIAFINQFIYLYIFLGILFIIIAGLSPIWFYSILSKFDITLLEKSKIELYISLLLFMLIIVCNILANILTSYKYFTMPNIVAFINSSISLLCLFLFYKKLGIISAMLGLAIGYIINIIFLVYFLKTKLNWDFFSVSKTFNKKIFKFIGNNQFIAFIIAMRGYVTQFLLSGLGSGFLSAISWGGQIASMGDTFINQQFYTVSGLKFSEHFTNNERKNVVKLFNDIFTLLFTVSCVLFTIYFCCSVQISNIVNFKHKFSPEILHALAISIVFLNIIPIINIGTFLATKLLASYQLINLKVLKYSFLGQFALLVLIATGIKIWGVYGYFIASITGFVFLCFLYFKIVKVYFKSFSILNLIKKQLPSLGICFTIVIAFEIVKKLNVLHLIHNSVIYIIGACTMIVLVFLVNLKENIINFKRSVQ